MSEVQALDRVVAVLNAFSPYHTELGVSEIARSSGLTKTTAHRLLGSLVEHGVVEKVGTDATYRLGGQILRWAAIAQVHVDVAALAKPLMFKLRDEVGETVGLHILDGTRHRKVIDQVESRHQVRRTYTEIGQPILLHLGAPGKVLLAYLPEDLREEFLESSLEPVAGHAPVNPRSLRRELSTVRKQGYALSIQERIPGVASMAVPVRDHTGQVHVALSVSGPASRLTRAGLIAAVKPAQEAATRLSDAIGAPLS